MNIICVWLDLLCVHMCECTPSLYVQMAWCDEGVLMCVGACQYGICVAHIYDRVMCVHVCVFILLTACLVRLCVLARMRMHVCVSVSAFSSLLSTLHLCPVHMYMSVACVHVYALFSCICDTTTSKSFQFEQLLRALLCAVMCVCLSVYEGLMCTCCV